jgi:KaiC/GvpD/RAD55 family RecA-like ATPase
MRRRGMGESEILAALSETNSTRCRPPLEPSEVAGIARSVASYPPAGAPSGAAVPAEGSQLPRLKLVRLDVGSMLKTEPPPVPWLAEPLLVRGAFTVLYGREGEGKSMVSLAVAVSVASGEPGAGFSPQPGRVLYIDAENGEREIHRRVRALGLPFAAADRLAIYATEGLDLRSDLGEIEAAIVAERPTLTVLDSFRTLWAGSENDSEEVAPVLDRLRNLGRRHDTATLLLHHTSKGGTSYRGSTSIGASAELAFLLARDSDDPDKQRRYLHCHKSRPAPEPGRRWLRLSTERGMTFVDEAEPFRAEGSVGRPGIVRPEIGPSLVAALRDSAIPMRLADLARAVGRDPKDRSVRLVLAALVDGGEVARGDDGRYLVSEGVGSGTPKEECQIPTPEKAHSGAGSQGCTEGCTGESFDTPHGYGLSEGADRS